MEHLKSWVSASLRPLSKVTLRASLRLTKERAPQNRGRGLLLMYRVGRAALECLQKLLHEIHRRTPIFRQDFRSSLVSQREDRLLRFRAMRKRKGPRHCLHLRRVQTRPLSLVSSRDEQRLIQMLLLNLTGGCGERVRWRVQVTRVMASTQSEAAAGAQQVEEVSAVPQAVVPPTKA